MSASECGVLSSRGWTGGLTLPVEVTNNSRNLVDATAVMSDLKATSTMSESAMTTSSVSSQGAASTNLANNSQGLARRGRASPAPVNRVPLVRQSEERKARRCRFYRNGDRWFPGALLAVSSDRHRTWDALLADVTRLLEHPLHLAAGVRYVFTLDGSKIDVLEQLEDSGEYVASSNDAFKTIDYRDARLPQWRLHTRRREALHVPSSARSSSSYHTNSSAGGSEVRTPEVLDDSSIRPRLVTVIRNGQRPRKAVRVLLNRRTARALDQVMEDLSVSLKLDTGAVRKIYTLDGRQISSLKELFQDDDVFIACGLERCSRDDFYLDNEESRSIQPLLKGPGLPGARKRMPSPKPRGRAISPLSRIDQTGSLPRTSRLNRESPSSRPPASPHISYPSTEQLFLPAAISSRYRVGRILGDGNFAVVRECQELATKRKFALKIIDKSKCQGKEDMIHSEVDILRKVSHENIVRLEDEVHCPDYLYLVMELVTGGDLFDAIAAATRYTEREAGHLVGDLAAALHYLHVRNIVHRDVKPENLLVVPGSTPRLKLGDFGLAVQLTEPLYTICGTPTYVAPEILAEHGYGLEVDIWAAGVIAYILLCGFPPFISASNNQEELFEQILAGHLSFPSPYWDHVSPQPRHLIAAMVLVDPNERLTADLVLGHPWIKGQYDEEESQDYTYHHEYDDYHQVPDEQHESSSPPCILSDLLGPPPAHGSDEDEENNYDQHQQRDYDHKYDDGLNQDDEREYDYQHNAISNTDSSRTSLPPIGGSNTPAGGGSSGAAHQPNRRRRPCSNSPNNSVSSSSGIDSSYASSNDNNKYNSLASTANPTSATTDSLSLSIATNSDSSSNGDSNKRMEEDHGMVVNKTDEGRRNNGNRTSDATRLPAITKARKSKSPAKRTSAAAGAAPVLGSSAGSKVSPQSRLS